MKKDNNRNTSRKNAPPKSGRSAPKGDNFIDDILRYMVDRNPGDMKPRALARQMRVAEENYGAFRTAYKQLRDDGRILHGTSKAMTLPAGDTSILGRFQGNERGFGFVVPSEQTLNSDLFIPAERTAGAVTGDLVLARIYKEEQRDGETRLFGEITEIKERGNTRIVGTLEKTPTSWIVIPDGRRLSTPVIIRDVSADRLKPGAKVQVDIIWYPPSGDRGFPEGTIITHLGESGEPVAEIRAVMAAHGLQEVFPAEVDAYAHQVAASFNPDDAPGREDLTSIVTCTIDPDTARDYDDAISLEDLPEGGARLGVHIADVSFFAKEGSVLDAEAYARGTSVYFPRYVVPMLPESLSNGVCSLQEGVKRFAKTAFIDYDKDGNIVDKRLCESVIRSDARLTYLGAQKIIDGDDGAVSAAVVALVRRMEVLARKIEARRRQAGMLHLDLPEIELVLDDTGRVTDAKPTDGAYTHKVIEMFMVEANDAVADIFRKLELPLVRRIHPSPDSESLLQLSRFVKACGHLIPEKPNLVDLQHLVAEVDGKPESYAVNLAVLRSFQRATYSIEPEGHFALASKDYCHFTSPIRRYPDLMVHRAVEALVKGRLKKGDAVDGDALQKAADFMSIRERIAQAAEIELRLTLVLLHLREKKGEVFAGVITGVTDFGIFVQTPKFLIEGLIRLPDLGDDWWEVTASEGKVRGDLSGKVLRIGDTLEVRIDGVDLPRRQLLLSPSYMPKKPDRQGSARDLSTPARSAPPSRSPRKPTAPSARKPAKPHRKPRSR